MRLRLRYFAAIREAMDLAGEDVETATAPVSLDELLDLIDRGRNREALRNPRLRVAVNGELLAAEAPWQLKDGDEVALLPPVTGG